MARARAAAYTANMRPYGQPAANFRDATPRPQTVGPNRNVHRVADTSVYKTEPESVLCVATKKNGEPCQGRPKGDSQYCVFHEA